MTDRKPLPHADNDLLEQDAPTPSPGGSSGGDMQREIGARGGRLRPAPTAADLGPQGHEAALGRPAQPAQPRADARKAGQGPAAADQLGDRFERRDLALLDLVQQPFAEALDLGDVAALGRDA